MSKVEILPRGRSGTEARIVQSVRLDIPVYNKVIALANLRHESASRFLSKIIGEAISDEKIGNLRDQTLR
jgi:hypothetical protein